MKPRKRLRRYLKCFVDWQSMHPWRGNLPGPCGILHRLAREEKSRHLIASHPGNPPRLIGQHLVQWILWTLFSIWQSVKLPLKPGRILNRNRLKDFLDIPKTFSFAMKFNIAPANYYLYNLHKGRMADEDICRYLTAWECSMVCRRISRLRGSAVGAIDNKDRFVEFCNRHQLPTIPIIQLEDPGESPILPQDLFAKGIAGHSGEECQLLSYQDSQDGWLLGKQLLQRDTLKTGLKNHFGDERFVVQYRIQNHPDMHWLSDTVLTTLRILTAWSPDGNPVILRATIRLPASQESFLDNSSQGGVAAPVDPATGIISGPATRWNQDFEILHPITTSRSFIGFKLPLWPDIRSLLHKAHRSADNYNFLGWDVAITEAGPLLVECNVWSDIDLVQVPQKHGILTDEVLACLQAEPTLREAFVN